MCYYGLLLIMVSLIKTIMLTKMGFPVFTYIVTKNINFDGTASIKDKADFMLSRDS